MSNASCVAIVVPPSFHPTGVSPWEDSSRCTCPYASRAEEGSSRGETTKPADTESADSKETDPTESKEESEKPAEEKPDPKAEYEKAIEQYKKDLERYENDLSEFSKKIEEGKKKVEELNARFGSWYYVISAESFENLRLSRSDLVKPKSEASDETEGGLNPTGGLPGIPGFPGTN